jgi:hypothetical protein
LPILFYGVYAHSWKIALSSFVVGWALNMLAAFARREL